MDQSSQRTEKVLPPIPRRLLNFKSLVGPINKFASEIIQNFRGPRKMVSCLLNN